MEWGMNNNEGIKNHNAEHGNTVEQPIPFFFGGDIQNLWGEPST
jgi:hypothetical protein